MLLVDVILSRGAKRWPASLESAGVPSGGRDGRRNVPDPAVRVGASRVHSNDTLHTGDPRCRAIRHELLRGNCDH
ncbi:MAG TPA: hypothetical protein VJ803_13100 [Gemmatimonadaceae bacterium]|nr:hypothetical protein [Gemmatimonadaceae bacterium]